MICVLKKGRLYPADVKVEVQVEGGVTLSGGQDRWSKG